MELSPKHESVKDFKDEVLASSTLFYQQRSLDVITGISIIGPITAVLIPHLFLSRQPVALLLAAAVFVSISLGNYLIYLKTRHLRLHAMIISVVLLALYALCLLITGGLHSHLLPLVTVFPVAAATLLGRSAAILSTATSVGFCGILAILTHLGWVPANEYPVSISISWLITSLGVTTVCIMITSLQKSQQNSEAALVQSVIALNQALQRSSESRSYLRVILDSMQQGAWGLDLEGKATFVNHAALRHLGYTDPSEIIGKSMHRLVHYAFPDGSPHPKEQCPMDDSYYNGNVHQISDDVLWKKDGTSFPVSYSSAPIIKDGICIGSVVAFENLIEKNRLEAELETERLKSIRNAKLASLGEISAGLAHEINNPLAIIDGTIQLLPKFFDDPVKLKSKMETITKACGRIAKIIRSLKKFSRSDEQSVRKPHALSEIVTETLNLTEARSSRFTTPVTFECNSTTLISCDEVEIEQVIVNLINNAVDAVQSQSEKWVRVSVFEEGPSIILRVMDSGPGIPKSIRKKLFDPFFTTKKVGEGTGLGLSIARGILQEHQATINILENLPHTCFEIRFPKVA